MDASEEKVLDRDSFSFFFFWWLAVAANAPNLCGDLSTVRLLTTAIGRTYICTYMCTCQFIVITKILFSNQYHSQFPSLLN